jgi:hypothetical protein
MTDEVYYEEIPASDPRLGRHIRHDERSKMYAFTGAGITPKSVRHTRDIPVFDQGNLGSCTGNAGLGCLGADPFYSTLSTKINDWSENAAVQLYSDATQLDSQRENYPPVDTGSDGLSIAKVLQKRGLISGYQHTFSFDSMLAALSIKPVIVGVNWYSSMFNTKDGGLVTIDPGATVEGGHEFVLDEIDMERQLIGATNSWGTGWGLGGRFYLSFDTVKRLLSEQGDVTVFMAVTEPAPTPVVPSPLVAPVPPVAPTPSTGKVEDIELWKAVLPFVNQPHAGTTKKVADALKKWGLTKGF